VSWTWSPTVSPSLKGQAVEDHVGRTLVSSASCYRTTFDPSGPPPVPLGLPVGVLLRLARQEKAPSDCVLGSFARATRPPVTKSNLCTTFSVAELGQDPLGVPPALPPDPQARHLAV
jgi:hypothetical protein